MKRKAHNAVKLRHGNITFPSIRAAALKLGIEEGTIANRLRKGWSVAEALEFKAREKIRDRPGIETVCDGVTYASVAALARQYKQNQIRVRKRISSGWTAEEAVGVSPPPPRFRNQSGAARDHAWTGRIVSSDGHALPSTARGNYRLYKILNRTNGKAYIGITTGDLKSRLRGHWGMVARGRHSKLYNAMRAAQKRGNKEIFIIELLRDDAVNFEELQLQEIEAIARFNTIENGYNTAVGGSLGTAKAIVVAGNKFSSRNAAAEYCGIKASVFNLRISRLGWSPERAVGLSDREAYENIPITVDGVHFGALNRAAKHFGIEYKLVHERLHKRGWTIEQAFELHPPPKSARSRGVRVTVRGESFRSIKQAAERFGVKDDSVTNRMRSRGETAEVAINALLKKQK